MAKKYSDNFNRDFNWYLKYRNIFTFTGGKPEIQIIPNIEFDINGIDGKKAFHIYDSQGKLKPTKHPNILSSLLCTKASINLQIKQWAQGRADGTLPGIEFSTTSLKKYCEVLKKDLEGFEPTTPESVEWYIKRLKDLNNLIEKNDVGKLTIEQEFELLSWMVEAVEKQKYKYY